MSTIQQIKSFIVSLLPPGADRLYNLDSTGGIGLFFDAIAESAKTFGYDLVDAIRLDANPFTVTANKLPEWEAAMGLGLTRVGLEGSFIDRRNAVIARLREAGNFSVPHIQAIVAPLLGYTHASDVIIIQPNRAALAALNTKATNHGPLTAGGLTTFSASVTDNAPNSSAGARILVNVTHPSIQDLFLTVIDPLHNSYVFQFGTGSVTGGIYIFPIPIVNPAVGTWTLLFSDTGVAGGTLNSGSVFVEGIGRSTPLSPIEGHGAGMFQWAVLVDPRPGHLTPASALVDYDYVLATLNRIKPAHTVVYLDYMMSDGTEVAIVDDPYCIADSCLVGP